MKNSLLIAIFLVGPSASSTYDHATEELGKSSVDIFEKFVSHAAVTKLCNDRVPYEDEFHRETRRKYVRLCRWARMTDAEFIRFAVPIIDQVHATLQDDPRCHPHFQERVEHFSRSSKTKPYFFYRAELEKVLTLSPEEERLDDEIGCILF